MYAFAQVYASIRTMPYNQTSANTSTWSRYSENIQNLPIFRGRIPRGGRGNSSLRIKFELPLQNSAKKWFIHELVFV